MTEKRFVYYEHKGADYILEDPNTDLDFIEMLGDCLDEKEIVNRLNGLYEENKELERQKEGYKRLSQIRENEVSNRILTINEFIDDYSDDYRIKNVLLDLFYSEVKEYDLSKKYMALKKENEQLRKENDMFSCELSVSANKEISRNCRIAELEEENKKYKSLFFELVETALTDKNCRELYCKGILDIFNKANSLNQAREMIKEHLE